MKVSGYTRLKIADRPNSFSLRGGILDIATKEKTGIRIELWGDVIDSIRVYNLDTQKSVEVLEKITIFPKSEYLLERNIEEIAKDIEEKIVVTEEAKKQVLSDIENIIAGNYYEYVEKYFSYFYKNRATILDYISEEDLIVIDDKKEINQTSNGLIKNYNIHNENIVNHLKSVPIDIYNYLKNYEEIIENISGNGNPLIYLNEKNEIFIDKNSMIAKRNETEFSYKEINFFRSEVDVLFKELALESTKKTIYIMCDANLDIIFNYLETKKNNMNLDFLNTEIAEKIRNLEFEKTDKKEEKPGIYLIDRKIPEGFEITEINAKFINISAIVKAKKEIKVSKDSFKKAEKIVFADLEVGDYVVHRVNRNW